METLLMILLTLLVLSFLVLIHEAGHYTAARLFHVTIEEFSIGMGPKICSKKSKKTGIAYSLRAFPIGGFVAMAGEDSESDDPNALNKKPVLQRILITVAGATMNILLGFLLMSILVSTSSVIGGTTIAEFTPVETYAEDGSVIRLPNVSEPAGLRVGDEVIKVGSVNVHTANELSYEICHQGYEPLDLTVLRDGEKVVIPQINFATTTEEGVTLAELDFRVYREEKNFGSVVRHSFFRSLSTIKMVWDSLGDLLTGRYGLEAVSGPVGMVEVVKETVTYGFASFLNLVVVITMNLGVFNLLPLPALDGGRLLFQLIELIFRKPVPQKYEAYVHFAGIVILLAFSALIAVKDVFKLFR